MGSDELNDTVRMIDYDATKDMVTRRRRFEAMTLAELISWAEEKSLDPAAVNLSAGIYARWEDQETDAERGERLAAMRRSDERHERWEREAYERLSAKYDQLIEKHGSRDNDLFC